MPTTVTIDQVTTGDAAPVVAPHRISNKATKDTASVTFTPTHDGVLYPSDVLIPGDDLILGAAQKILAVRVTDGGGISPYTGTLVGRKGLLATDQIACSESLACTDWESPSGTQLSEDVTYAETGAPADGPQAIYVWVNTNKQGWS